MKRYLLAAAAALLVPAAAQAQDMGSGLYAGAQAGYHDFRFGLNSTFVGGYLGFNAPVGETLVAGLEGNANLSVDGDADAEYGASAHLGVRTGNGMVFGRVGYQEVDFEGGSDGDVMYGVGGEFGLNERSAFRVTLDTIDFDSTRVAAGVTFKF
jgi:outer membrane immunogenic protein